MKLAKSTAAEVAKNSNEKIQERLNFLISEIETLVAKYNELSQNRNSIQEQMGKLEAELLTRQGAIRELQALLPPEESKTEDVPAA